MQNSNQKIKKKLLGKYDQIQIINFLFLKPVRTMFAATIATITSQFMV